MSKQLSRREARKILSRFKQKIGDGGEVSHLNITAMMDMMTILLVFLIKQFAVTQSSLTISDQLQLPKSSATLKASPEVNVTVTTQAIIVEGEPVTAVRAGAVDPTAKRDGPNGFYITNLVDTLQKHANRLKKVAMLQNTEFNKTMLLLVDRSIPYRLVTEVLYSAGQAEFSNYRLVVLSKGE